MTQQKPLEILVIDDKLDVALALQSTLEEIDDINVTTKFWGQEGIDEFMQRYEAQKPYDLVFTDYDMPFVDGNAVIQTIKGLSPKTYVFLVTAKKDSEPDSKILSELGQHKPDGIIPKPWTMDQIETLVKTVRDNLYGTNSPNPQS